MPPKAAVQGNLMPWQPLGSLGTPLGRSLRRAYFLAQIYPTSKNQDDDRSKKCQDEKTSCPENFFLDNMNRSNCWEFITPIKRTQDMNTVNFQRWNLHISSLFELALLRNSSPFSASPPLPPCTSDIRHPSWFHTKITTARSDSGPTLSVSNICGWKCLKPSNRTY